MKKSEIIFLLCIVFFWSIVLHDSSVTFFTKKFYLYTFFNLVYFSMIWYGSKAIIKLIDTKLSWETNAITRFLIEIPLFIFLGIIILIFINVLEFFLHSKNIFHAIQWEYAITRTTLITLLISSIHEGIYFFKKYMKSQFEAERFEKEMLKSQLDTIRSQINPHFLFNSLSILNVLISNDQKEAASNFVHNLSDFLRYNLDNKELKTVRLSDELEMVQKYVWLLMTRYQDNIIFSINIEDQYRNQYYVPPLSIQMLVENAIKHNKATKKSPLTIRLTYCDDHYICVKNNIQKNKKLDSINSTKTGLSNIRIWYDLLAGKEIRITSNDDFFEVSLPLLNEQYEHTNS